MGLLTRLPFLWQSQSPLAALGQPQSPVAGPMAAIPGVVPFAPNQQPEAGAPGAPFSMSPPNKPPAQQQGGFLQSLFGQQQGQGGGGGFGDRLNNAVNSPLFNVGMALLAGSENGGDWGVTAGHLRQYGQDQMQRRQLENAERRAKMQEGRETEQWSWMRDERTQQAERRRLAQEYIASRPANEQAELRMIDPDQLGAYIQDQRQYGLQERQLDLQLAEMRNNNAYRAASLDMDRRRLEQDRILNSAQSVLGREEASRLGADMQRLRGWSLIDNDLGALEEILERNPAAFNNLMDADVEQALARIRDPQTRRDVQTIYSIATSMAREELRGQTPVSNIDLLSAVRGAPSPSSGHRFARDWLSRAYQDRSDLENYVQSAIEYMQTPDGGRRTLFEADPATGRNFYQSDAFRRYTQDGRQSFRDVSEGRARRWGDLSASERERGRGGEADSAAEELRRREQSGGAGLGTLGGRPGAPQLLREPRQGREQVLLRQYEAALRNNQQERARTFERELRRAGLIS